MGFIQTETAYYQPHPNASQFQSAPDALSRSLSATDPDFVSFCADRNGTCKEGWALRILSTTDILCYGAGLYSFFNNHNTACSNVGVENCQTQIFGVDSGSSASSKGKKSSIQMYNLNTVGSVAMATVNDKDVAFEKDNTGPFPECIALFLSE
jgi:glucan 1,3-beta-glucosidase